MLYELPDYMKQKEVPDWPKGIAGIPVTLDEGSEVKLPILAGVNCLTLGMVGTGKTTLITVPATDELLASNSDMKGVFFEIKRSFIDRFMKDNDKVITHDPSAVSPANLFIPNVIKEIRQSVDREAEMKDLADYLFAELLDNSNQNRAWIEAARDTFTGYLRVIVDTCSSNTGNKSLISQLRGMTDKELLQFLAKHPANASMLTKDWSFDLHNQDNYETTKRGKDIMFFLNRIMEKFSGAFYMDGTDTLHDWFDGRYGRNLFFLYDLKQAEICRPFFLYYLKKINTYKMSNSSGFTAPILEVLDEIDKMADAGKPADFGLFQAATLGRECGLQILLTTQSIENLYGLAPNFNEHITDGGLAGFPYLICFRPGDPKSIETMQKLYGSEPRERTIIPSNRYAAPIVKCDIEPIVNDKEFASLNTGECIVKIMSKRPVKVRFKLYR